MADTLQKSLILWRNLGKIYYKDGLTIMRKLTREHLASLQGQNRPAPKNMLLLCEHFPVYTTGVRDKNVKDIEYLERLGAEFQFTDRGGLITFHGPGQLMCYPILNLTQFKKSISWYNQQLEEVGILTCKKFGIIAKRTSNPGVWVDDSKIAAIGFHVSRWITSHGLALNCNVDLGWFDHIVPCGLEGKSVTSLSVETWKDVKVNSVIQPFLESFQQVFNCELRQDDSEYANKVENNIKLGF